MTVGDRIEINPSIMLGKPVIRGTRIPVELLIRKLSEGATEADLLDGYPRLTSADIRAFVVVQPGAVRITRKPDLSINVPPTPADPPA